MIDEHQMQLLMDEAYVEVTFAIQHTLPGHVVYDGSAYSPSTRALPNAAYVWEHGTPEDYERFEAYLDAITLPDGECFWEDGILWRS